MRVAWFYVPNGIDMRHWTPATEGALGELPAILAPFDPVKKELLVLSNLTTHWGRPLQAGPGDHGRALGSYMTGVEVYKTAGADLKLGDFGGPDRRQRRRPPDDVCRRSRSVSRKRGQAGNCDSGYSCAYTYNLAWKTETQPLPPISDPRIMFERLFGSDIVEPPAARARRLEMRRSILDGVLERHDEAAVHARRYRIAARWTST